MRDGDKRPYGAVLFLITNSRRGVRGNRNAISYVFLIFFLLSFFFTYSEALPALRLRRDDIFGPPVGSALNNP